MYFLDVGGGPGGKENKKSCCELEEWILNNFCFELLVNPARGEGED